MGRLDHNFPQAFITGMPLPGSPIYKIDGDTRDKLAVVSSAMSCISMMLGEVTETSLPHDGLAAIFDVMADQVTAISREVY